MTSATAGTNTAQAWISRLVEATQDAVITMDDQSRIVLFNAAAERMFGYTAADVQGKDVAMLMPQPYRSQHAQYVARYEATGEPHAIGRIRSVTARRASGEEFPIELSVTEVPDGEGTRYGAFIRDISDKVRLHRELLDRERMAAIGTTAAKFAHEVSNPLNGMYTQAQLMRRRLARDDDADPRLCRGVDHLLTDLERLNGLLEEFRALSRRQDYRRVPMSIRDVCQEVAAERTVLHGQRGIVVVDALPATLPLVLADYAKLKQVLLNLCKNAEEAMPEGGTLTLRAVVQGDRVRLSIADTGIGVPPDVDIFAPFETTKAAGTGLGLPIVREILAAHGGTVRFDSDPGHGTTFEITLPISV